LGSDVSLVDEAPARTRGADERGGDRVVGFGIVLAVGSGRR
jgi:hypothetical protein